MKKLKKLMLVLLVTTPILLSAGGIGLYIPYSSGDTSSVTLSYADSNSPDEDVDFDLQSSTGLGFMYDSNLGKDSLFNYRLGLEYIKEKTDSVDGVSCVGDCEFGTRYNIVQTFGFGVLRTKIVRLWVGPRINIAGDSYSNADLADFKRVGFEIGIAPAVGVNVNLGRYFALAADVDYRFAATVGVATSDIDNSDFSYSGSTKGATARFYAIFKFGEDYQEVYTAE